MVFVFLSLNSELRNNSIYYPTSTTTTTTKTNKQTTKIKLQPRLSRVFAFNPDFGPREETEHLKLLFYWPPGATQNARGNDVGLSEAITNFSRLARSDAHTTTEKEKKQREKQQRKRRL